MYSYNLSKVYDKIYSNKDYHKEVEYIINKYHLYKKIDPKSLLDVGCGTGNHSVLFSNYCKTLGIDTSKDMINQAKEKENEYLKFKNIKLNNIRFKKFDIIVSLFNVINHINNIEELNSFFKNIRKKLKGIFVFDVFNQINTILFPPKKEMRGKLTIDPSYEIYKSKLLLNNKYGSFRYKIEMTMWQPIVIKQLLENNKLKISSINSDFSENDFDLTKYRNVYTCKKNI